MKKSTIMTGLILLLSMLVGIVAAVSARQQEPKVIPLDVTAVKVDEFFPRQEGTFILKDMQTGKMFVYNPARANVRQSPCSTFKIMNSLIGLQTKVVQDEYDVKRWDGTDRGLAVWNRDHTLGSAMRYSVVWYYQAMARDIGAERMQYWLDQCSYGNRDISGGIDQFWLNSSLAISPLEQVEFLEQLYAGTLPFDKDVMKTVKRMMLLEEGDTYALYGKTGSSKDNLGWFVGFVNVKGRTYLYATQLDSPQGNKTGGAFAKKVTLDILKKYSLIDK